MTPPGRGRPANVRARPAQIALSWFQSDLLPTGSRRARVGGGSAHLVCVSAGAAAAKRAIDVAAAAAAAAANVTAMAARPAGAQPSRRSVKAMCKADGQHVTTGARRAHLAQSRAHEPHSSPTSCAVLRLMQPKWAPDGSCVELPCYCDVDQSCKVHRCT